MPSAREWSVFLAWLIKILLHFKSEIKKINKDGNTDQICYLLKSFGEQILKIFAFNATNTKSFILVFCLKFLVIFIAYELLCILNFSFYLNTLPYVYIYYVFC